MRKSTPGAKPASIQPRKNLKTMMPIKSLTAAITQQRDSQCTMIEGMKIDGLLRARIMLEGASKITYPKKKIESAQS